MAVSRIKFTRIGPGGIDRPAGEVWIENGMVMSDRDQLQHFLRRTKVFSLEGKTLKPSDEAFLEAVCQMYGRGSYMRCEPITEEGDEQPASRPDESSP